MHKTRIVLKVTIFSCILPPSYRPITPNILVADNADDKAIISTSVDPIRASTILQNHPSNARSV